MLTKKVKFVIFLSIAIVWNLDFMIKASSFKSTNLKFPLNFQNVLFLTISKNCHQIRMCCYEKHHKNCADFGCLLI